MKPSKSSWSFELTATPWLRRLLLSRWPQWLITVIALAFLSYAALAGLFGTEVGNRNLGTVLVWIAWWAILILFLVPMGGRAWCSICPVPVPGEWLQRRGLTVRRGARTWGLGRRWPRRLRNLWPQNIGFLLVSLFSAVVLTQPRATGVILVGILLLALVTSAVFERRTFCRYLCPVGGFIGLYSMASPLALRVVDRQVCREHRTKDCYVGNDQGYGCPWLVYPGNLERNAACGLCLECLRTCPLDNVALVVQSPSPALEAARGRPALGLDEAFKGFIMLAAAGFYGAVYLGPWGELKLAAYNIGSTAWMLYAASLVVAALIVLPGLYLFAAKLGELLDRDETTPLRERFLRGASGLVPLGLASWAAFSLSLVLVSGSYVPAVLSDPMGWGWDLFGTAAISWRPYLSGAIPALQVAILLIGLAWTSAVGLRSILGGEAPTFRHVRSAMPTLLLNAGVVMVQMGLYL